MSALKETDIRKKEHFFTAGTELSSEASPFVLSRFPGLQISAFPDSFSYSFAAQWIDLRKETLPVNSDRIAQDFHLIPFSCLN